MEFGETSIVELVASYGLGVSTLVYFLWEKTKEVAACRQEIKELHDQLLREVKDDET